jgi:hypothetical protein
MGHCRENDTADLRLRIPDSRFQIQDFRFKISDSRDRDEPGGKIKTRTPAAMLAAETCTARNGVAEAPQDHQDVDADSRLVHQAA